MLSSRLLQIRVATDHLSRSRAHLQRTIEERADELCRLVLLRRDALVKELEKEWTSCTDRYEVTSEGVRRSTRNIDDALRFVDDFLPQCSKVNGH